ncbi:nitroreductase family protein [Robertkochia solimangrovi]|uniref:nitroreductase family protein n=1 Tax=Robertkochia solimangrovi TaxID=2213046 RepID=UPI00117E136C|nr:nitroreductase family protein [Robertkochia solimangrovi]TRZ46027.1 hypothetical protein DMZ48_01795 [Robertkochia solimangrovi]
MKIKESIKNILPTSWVVRLKQMKDYSLHKRIVNEGFAYDKKKFEKNSASFNLNTNEKLKSFLIKEYHAIEKGLALQRPKVGFGQERIKNLIEYLSYYIDEYGVDDVIVVTKNVLLEYKSFDEAYNKDKNELIPLIDDILKKITDHNLKDIRIGGGTKKIKKSDVFNSISNIDFDTFFKTRYSVRDFSDEPVNVDVLLEAIDTAKYVPSVCNRQPWKAYVIRPENTELKSKLLSVQNGNKGFGDSISSLIVVTGKLSHFFAYERNQVFIDGGMFAMSIVLALHSKGFGTCCLNLSYTAEMNRKFDEIMNFDKDTVPIMYIAVGNLKQDFKVAISNRKLLNEIVKVY